MPRNLYWLADRMAPAVRRRFLQAVVTLRGDVTVSGLLTGRLDEPLARFATNLRRSTALLEQVFAGSMESAAQELQVRAGASFDIVNPLALDAARFRSSLLIREITEDTRAGIQRIVRRGIAEGLPPRETAKLIRPLIGLTQNQGQAVMNLRQRLLDQGLSTQAAGRKAGHYAVRKLAERATTIARTETIRASVDGTLAAWRGALDQGLLSGAERKAWIAAEDERLCPICDRLHKEDPVPLAGTFWAPGMRTGVQGPPAHPRCRCTIGLVYARAGSRRGRRAS